jgi:hypothetical protein
MRGCVYVGFCNCVGVCMCGYCNCMAILVMCNMYRLPWLRFFRSFSSVVRQMPGLYSQRWGTARTLVQLLICVVQLLIWVVLLMCYYLEFVINLCCSVNICVVQLIFVLFNYYLYYSMYCLRVYGYWTTATGCLPNCSWQIYHIICCPATFVEHILYNCLWCRWRKCL